MSKEGKEGSQLQSNVLLVGIKTLPVEDDVYVKKSEDKRVPSFYQYDNPAFILNEGVSRFRKSPGFRMYWHDLKVSRNVYLPFTHFQSISSLQYVVNSFNIGTHLMNKMNGTVPKTYQRMISKGVNGSLESGKMTALMGPSGAGKTVLLESLIGKRTKGLSGEVFIQPMDSNAGSVFEIRMAIIPQADCFVTDLSVKETIVLASRLKNVHMNGIREHERTALEMMTRAGLAVDQDSMVGTLRPGQRKRLAVAAELVNRPNFLVLDEVTTGLDSFSAKQVIELLRELAEQDNIAILCSIHQPAWSVVQNFDKIYMLSPVIGKCIYEGSPNTMMAHLANYDLVPEMKGNAADFILDVATGKIYDKEVKEETLQQLAEYQMQNFKESFDPTKSETREFFSALEKGKTRFPFFRQTWILISKHCTMFFRQKVLLGTTILGYIVIAVFYAWFFDFPGEASGCPPSLEEYTDDMTQMNASIFSQLQVQVDREYNLMKQNLGSNMFVMLTGIFFVMIPSLSQVRILHVFPVQCSKHFLNVLNIDPDFHEHLLEGSKERLLRAITSIPSDVHRGSDWCRDQRVVWHVVLLRRRSSSDIRRGRKTTSSLHVQLLHVVLHCIIICFRCWCTVQCQC